MLEEEMYWAITQVNVLSSETRAKAEVDTVCRVEDSTLTNGKKKDKNVRSSAGI